MTQQSGPALTNTRKADDAKVLPSHYTVNILLTYFVSTNIWLWQSITNKVWQGHCRTTK